MNLHDIRFAFIEHLALSHASPGVVPIRAGHYANSAIEPVVAILRLQDKGTTELDLLFAERSVD